MTSRSSLCLLIVLCIVTPVANSQNSPNVCVKHIVSPLRYPPIARQARIQGTVVAKLRVGADGTVQQVNILTDDLLLRAHPILQSETEKIVREWTFECSGCASPEFEHTVRFTYRLEGEDSQYDTSKVTMDLPTEVIITTAPPVCDHCPAKEKR